jgi:glycosyltransferase involved in cell wall biosynthesis
VKMSSVEAAAQLQLLSVVIPARDEEECIARTVEHLHVELRLNSVPHEIIVVDDGSVDKAWEVLQLPVCLARKIFQRTRLPKEI